MTYTRVTGIITMIKTFKDKDLEKLYFEQSSIKIPKQIQKAVLRKLICMNSALDINDLRSPPSNKLEKLVRDRTGQYSIRVNKKYRICFIEKDNDYYDLELVDYH